MQLIIGSTKSKTTVKEHIAEKPLFTGHIPSLDGFRAISILLVILSHLAVVNSVPVAVKDVLKQFAFGELGVRVFFVISGFLITYLLLKEKTKNGKVNLRAFYIRRFLRIFPVFYVYLAVVLVLNAQWNLSIGSLTFVSAALYIQNFAPWGSNWLIAHSWSLAVEEQFYIFWPAVFRRLKKDKLWIAGIIIFSTGVFMRAVHYKFPELSRFLLAPFFVHADFLFAGCLLAFLLFSKPSLVARKVKGTNPLLVYVAILSVWFFSKFEYHPEYDKFFIPISGSIINICIVFLLAYFVIRNESSGYKLLNTPVFSFVGRLSYGLYVWQQLFLVPAYHNTSKAWWTQFPQNIILVFTSAYLSYLIVEKPFLKLKSKFKV